MGKQHRRATRAKRFEWLNPELNLYIGYNFHVVDDPATKGTKRRKKALEVVEQLKNLKAPEGTRDAFYLMEINAVLVSYAGALARHKKWLLEELTSAQEAYDNQQLRLFGSRSVSAGFAAGMRVGMLGVLFGIGASLARTLAPFIPEDLGSATGKAPPSFLLGFTFVVIGRLASMVWDYFRQLHLTNQLDARKDSAWDVYGRRRLKEYQQHLFDLIEIWDAYTGKKYKVITSIESILEDDLYLQRGMVRRRKKIARSQIGTMREAFQRNVVDRLHRKKPPKVERVAASVPAALPQPVEEE